MRNVFLKELEYVSNIINELNISNNKTNVALISFSGNKHNIITHSFNDVQNKEIVLRKLKSIC